MTSLYPKIRNVKKDNIAIKVMIIISIIVSLICLITNICTSTKYMWSFIVIIGIIYSWVTVMYSIHRNVNIASNVMIQLIAISIITICIDYIIGYAGWSVNLAIPIIIMVANTTMFILTISSFHKYKYAIYQLIIFVLSIIPLGILFIANNIITEPLFTIISSSIAVFTFVFSLILCGRNIIEELDRRLHM